MLNTFGVSAGIRFRGHRACNHRPADKKRRARTLAVPCSILCAALGEEGWLAVAEQIKCKIPTTPSASFPVPPGTGATPWQEHGTAASSLNASISAQAKAIRPAIHEGREGEQHAEDLGLMDALSGGARAHLLNE